MWKLFWKIIILIVATNCSRTFHNDFKLNNQIYEGKEKVVLIGFMPFKVSEINRGILKNEIVVEQDYENSLKYLFIHPNLNIDILPKKEKNLGKSKEAILFLSGYLNEVGKSGFIEINKFISINKKDFIQYYSDVDFYIIGVFGPDFSIKVSSSWNGLSNIISLLTLGIFPAQDEYIIYSTFYIFNKNFKPINGIRYESKYKVITAIWMIPDKNFDTFFSSIYTGRKEVYKEFIDKFNYDYPNLIKPKK